MTIDEENLEEIIDAAVRENAAKEHLRSVERRRKFRLWVIPLVAVAAVASVFLVMDYRIAERGYDAASFVMRGTAYLDRADYRGVEQASEALLSAAEQIYRGECSAAEESLDEAWTLIETEISNLGNNDSDIMRRVELESLLEDVKWYKAINYLKSKHPRKARRILQEFAGSESVYAGGAAGLIEEIWGSVK